MLFRSKSQTSVSLLTRDLRTHPNSQIDLDRRDLLALCFSLSLNCACSSNTGSIILHGRHVADVNIATTARWEPSRLRNDAGFVEGWVRLLPSAYAALVEGVL